MAGGCTALLLALPALAADASSGGQRELAIPRFEVAPWGGYRFGGSFDYATGADTSTTFDLGDDAAWGMDIGLYRDAGSFYELLFSSQSARLDTSGVTPEPVRLKTDYYHIGGTLLFQDTNGFVPWLSMTAGVTRFDPSGTLDGSTLGSESAFSISLGGGLRVPLNRNFSVVGGVRGYISFIDSSSTLFCVSSGGAVCAFTISGSSFFQFEGLLGLALTF
jgi:hypothetical protein